MNLRVFWTLALIASFGLGCAGAHGAMTFRQLKHPVSFSPHVEVDGKVLAREQMTDLGKVTLTKTYWGFLYAAVALTGEHDFSAELNEAISRRQARGIHSLKVTVSPCPTSYAVPLTWIMWLPSCARVRFEGTLFK